MTDKRKLQYVTLLWEELPEEIRIFVIPRSEMDKADLRMLRACHLNYLGAAGKYTEHAESREIDIALVRILNMLTDPDASYLSENYRAEQAEQLDMDIDSFNELVGSWKRFELDCDSPRTIPRSKMYRSGYLR